MRRYVTATHLVYLILRHRLATYINKAPTYAYVKNLKLPVLGEYVHKIWPQSTVRGFQLLGQIIDLGSRRFHE